MTHMLKGITTSRFFSAGSEGTSPFRGNGPAIPLFVQYTPLTCARAGDGTRNVTASSAATMPSLFMGATSSDGGETGHFAGPGPLRPANIARRPQRCQEGVRPLPDP